MVHCDDYHSYTLQQAVGGRLPIRDTRHPFLHLQILER
jgi:hypothetical protein